MKFSSGIFLGIVMIASVFVLGFSIHDAFAADQKITFKDKKLIKSTNQQTVESFAGLKPNEKSVMIFYKNNVKSTDLTELLKKNVKIKGGLDKMHGVAVQVDAAKLKEIQKDKTLHVLSKTR